MKKRRASGKNDQRKSQATCACACSCLRQAARAITQLYDEAFRPMGCRATQFGILGVAEELGAVTLSELAEETVTDRTTLTRNLRLLERKGLIGLECGQDRRERRVCLTQRGSRVLQTVRPAWIRVQEKVIHRVGRRRFERIVSDLSAVIEAAQTL